MEPCGLEVIVIAHVKPKTTSWSHIHHGATKEKWGYYTLSEDNLFNN